MVMIEMYDLMGDIHGHSIEVLTLLAELGK